MKNPRMEVCGGLARKIQCLLLRRLHKLSALEAASNFLPSLSGWDHLTFDIFGFPLCGSLLCGHEPPPRLLVTGNLSHSTLSLDNLTARGRQRLQTMAHDSLISSRCFSVHEISYCRPHTYISRAMSASPLERHKAHFTIDTPRAMFTSRLSRWTRGSPACRCQRAWSWKGP